MSEDIRDRVEAHFRTATRFHLDGQYDASIKELQAALKLMPESPEAHFNMANVLRDSGNLDLAVEGFIFALKMAEKQNRIYPEALQNLGDVFNRQGRLDYAIEAFTQSVVATPEKPEAHIGLGMVHYGSGNYAEAIRNFDNAIRLAPQNPPLLNNIGLAQYRLGEPEKALKTYDHIVKIDPSYPEGHTHRALMLMLLGDLAEGFAEYEWRWQTEFFKKMQPLTTAPRWQGEELSGKSIIVFGEQGYGDTIQFCRYLPLLAERGTKVMALVENSLVGLLNTLPNVQAVSAMTEPWPPHDYVLPMMSLPHRFGTTAATIPNKVPYLQADPARVEYWRGRLAHLPGKKVGLVWAGRPEHLFDQERSLDLILLQPLAKVPGVSLIALQQGPRAGEVGINAMYRPGKMTDFADTAALMSALDLVISVDTAPVHLAGALGLPTWLILPEIAEWRWRVSGETSAWYPTMRIFRRGDAGWEGVIREMAESLNNN
jgi:Tfp pilus assembly protein PilF